MYLLWIWFLASWCFPQQDTISNWHWSGPSNGENTKHVSSTEMTIFRVSETLLYFANFSSQICLIFMSSFSAEIPILFPVSHIPKYPRNTEWPLASVLPVTGVLVPILCIRVTHWPLGPAGCWAGTPPRSKLGQTWAFVSQKLAS